MTFSMGLKLIQETEAIVTEESIRSYYKDIIEKDRTMIQSLRDVVMNGIKFDDTCNIEDD
jgi:hypothetical protein